MPPLLLLRDISLTFGATPLLTGAELTVAPGDRVCLVGRNGSGKSTLLRVAAGLAEPDAGERFVQPGASIRYLSQEPDIAGFTTTLAYAEAGFDAGARDSHRALYLLKELGLRGDEDRISCCWTSRPTTSICPASNGSSGSCPRFGRRSCW